MRRRLSFAALLLVVLVIGIVVGRFLLGRYDVALFEALALGLAASAPSAPFSGQFIPFK